jgi:hypothetical protein
MLPTKVVLGQAKHTEGGSFIDWDKPSGMYPVEVVDVVTKEGTKYQSTELEQKLVFSLVPVAYRGEGVFTVWTNFLTNEKSNFTALCRALGVPIPADGQDITPDMFVGRQCQALIEYVPSTKKPGVSFARITKLLPLPQPQAGTGSAPQAPASPPEGDIPF